MKHVLAEVDKRHFSQNEFFQFSKLFTKAVLSEKKIILIFNNFLVIKSFIRCAEQQGRMNV